jgi:acetyl esterase/lipase
MRFSSSVNTWAAFAAIATVLQVYAQQTSDRFGRWDANKDGKVVRDELPDNQKPNFSKIDANSDGAISREELNAYTRGGGEGIKPTHADVAYGPHERSKIDLYLAESTTPTPLVVYIHGGGFQANSKESVSAQLLKACLDSGISVAATNYRLSPEYQFPTHYMDSARAIQFLRSKAKEYNLDPKRVAATGASAGGATSLWIAFHKAVSTYKRDS